MNKKISVMVMLAMVTLTFSGVADAAQPAKTRLLMKTKNASISVTGNVFMATVHNPTGQVQEAHFTIAVVGDSNRVDELLVKGEQWKDVAPFASAKLFILLDSSDVKRVREYTLKMGNRSLIPTVE